MISQEHVNLFSIFQHQGVPKRSNALIYPGLAFPVLAIVAPSSFCSSKLWAGCRIGCIPPSSSCSAPLLNVTKTARPCSALLHLPLNLSLGQIAQGCFQGTALQSMRPSGKPRKPFGKSKKYIFIISITFQYVDNKSSIASWRIPWREALWILEHVVHQSVT